LGYSKKIRALSGQSHLPRRAIKQPESELTFQLPYQHWSEGALRTSEASVLCNQVERTQLA
jgi:hypothetical protein